MRTRTLLGALAATSCLLGASAPAHAAALPTWDHQTIDESAEGAHFEIDMGRIARRHAATAEGRRLGALMVRDHEGELHAVQALAATLGVEVPQHPSAVERHEISMVASHTGTAFDRAYARLESTDHVDDVQSADGEAVEGTDPAVKAFAAKYRLMYLRHLHLFDAFAQRIHAGG